MKTFLIILMGLIVSASVANSVFGFYRPPEKFSGYVIGRSGSQPFVKAESSTVLPAPPEGERTVRLGYRNYAFYFPDSGSETIALKKDQRVKFEGILSGPEALKGCMKSIRTPWGSKVFKPGDNTFSFAPQETGTFTFTCGMGMGTGTIIVEN